MEAAGPPRTLEELHAVEGGSRPGLLNRLKALEQLGLASSTGRGVKGDPVRWRLVSARPGGAVRDDPAYVAYLKSPEWAKRRLEALTRANGRCQRCGAVAAEVHHLTYKRVGAELPEDLEALCAPCHRNA